MRLAAISVHKWCAIIISHPIRIVIEIVGRSLWSVGLYGHALGNVSPACCTRSDTWMLYWNRSRLSVVIPIYCQLLHGGWMINDMYVRIHIFIGNICTARESEFDFSAMINSHIMHNIICWEFTTQWSLSSAPRGSKVTRNLFSGASHHLMSCVVWVGVRNGRSVVFSEICRLCWGLRW